MNKRWKQAAAVVCSAALCLSVSACSKTVQKVPTNDKGKLVLDESWNLTLDENFDGAKLNTDVWQYKEEGVRRGGYWANDACFVKDGALTIRTNYREDGKFGSGWYTGAVETYRSAENGKTSGGFNQQYGYFEAKCKVPAFLGGWAAFWLMPEGRFQNDTPGTGEDGAEIDIFESPFYAFEKEQNCVSHAVHIDGYGEALKTQKGPYHYEVEKLYDEFHTFGLMWTEEEYVFYIDGHETWRTKDKVGTVAKIKEYILLSVEVGGYEKDGKVHPGREVNGETGEEQVHWSGDTQKNDKTKNYDFVVDYVKVWQKK